MNFHLDIQGLRAIAILLVILCHGEVRFFQGGFVGVDVFFVLSGFLITGQLLVERETSGRIHLFHFYERRLRRLLPAMCFMLVVMRLAAPWVLSEHALAEQTASLAYAATWTSNLYFAFTEVNYFSELKNRDWFIHTWSLGLEQQFYWVWPLVLCGTHALSMRLYGTLSRRLLSVMVASVFVSSLALSRWGAMSNASATYYLLPSRFWQFALGAGVYLLLRASPTPVTGAVMHRWIRAKADWLSCGGLLLILAASLCVDNQTPYPGLVALVPSLGAALVIAASAFTSWSGVLLKAPMLVWIGNRSYSWYLWHWPVFMIGFEWGQKEHAYSIAAMSVFSLLLAALSYSAVELPFWKGRWRSLPGRQVFLLSILAMLTPVALSWNYAPYLHQNSVEPQLAVEHEKATAANDAPAIYDQGCDSAFLNAELHPCFVGAREGVKTVVLLGDSISAQWISMVPLVFKPPQWRVVLFTKSSCPMVDEEVHRANGQVFSICSNWREKVLAYLPELKPDVVLMGSAASYGFTERQWVDGSSRVLDRLTAVAQHTIVIAGTPKLTFNGPECLQRLALNGALATCREPLISQQAAEVAGYLAQAVGKHKKAKLVNLNDLVCPHAICQARLPDGLVVFRDSQHLTDTFVKHQADEAGRRVSLLLK